MFVSWKKGSDRFIDKQNLCSCNGQMKARTFYGQMKPRFVFIDK